jgi:hypothetical protein
MVLDSEASYELDGTIKDIVDAIPEALSITNQSDVRNRLYRLLEAYSLLVSSSKSH